MRAVKAGNAADGLPGSGVDNIDAGTAGQVKPVRDGIDQQIVPAAFAAQLPAVEDLVWLLRREKGRCGQKAAEQGGGKGGRGRSAMVAPVGHGNLLESLEPGKDNTPPLRGDCHCIGREKAGRRAEPGP